MNTLHVELTHCYGIKTLAHDFDFNQPSGTNRPAKAYAIYAPNGCMKSSFAKTFDQLSQGKSPIEERYQRTPAWEVHADGSALPSDSIYVLKADVDTKADIPAVTNLLVKPEQKERYDDLVVDLEKRKQKVLAGLNKASGGLAKKKIEEQLPAIFETNNFLEAIRAGMVDEPDQSLSVFNYNTIFDEKALKVIQGREFREKATEFNQRYDELFQMENTIYSKGLFNPARAEVAFGSLKKERFFSTGHRVQLRGESAAIDEAELQSRIDKIHARIDGDQALQKLRRDLANTAEARALTDLIESLDNHQFDYLVEQTRPENEKQFRQKLWGYYLHQIPDAAAYRDEYDGISSEIQEIELRAAEAVPAWEIAVARFNRRFINMPFRLRIANQRETALGKEPARLLFVFEEDGETPIEWQKAEVKTLSQGERRAMHLLSFIFEVEVRKQSGQETLFICDDPADSFDYKNKHAIVQYLEDLTKVDHYHQIILTHNFDLLRTLTKFVHRDRCLAAIRGNGGAIQLEKLDGISNVFINVWKSKVTTSDAILLATIPFTRNLIEYTTGEQSPDYLQLTSLLHWKQNSSVITVGQYLDAFNRLFQANHATADSRIVLDLLISQADAIYGQTSHNELQLENKIVLSIAIRVKAEKFMTEQLRNQKSEPNYWFQEKTFGKFLNEFKKINPSSEILELLESVSVTVSSNIHLNSFMYEPILDLSTDHLCHLYRLIKDL
jgi:hypothetical protein